MGASAAGLVCGRADVVHFSRDEGVPAGRIFLDIVVLKPVDKWRRPSGKAFHSGKSVYRLVVTLPLQVKGLLAEFFVTHHDGPGRTKAQQTEWS